MRPTQRAVAPMLARMNRTVGVPASAAVRRGDAPASVTLVDAPKTKPKDKDDKDKDDDVTKSIVPPEYDGSGPS